MPCYHPLQAKYVFDSQGSRSIEFVNYEVTALMKLYPDKYVKLPCGRCIGCRLERSRQWAIRCMHEASLHDDNCFITLTYNDDNLPDDFSLDKCAFQKFMKRLRKKFGEGIRYYHCGEYGEKFSRPHYHACLFGFDFPDKVLFKDSNGVKLYVSESLQKLWPFGYSTIGAVSFESAAYVARYIMKKVNGKDAKAHYSYVGLDGEIIERKPEYTTMSRRPGIGRDWYEKFKSDVYPSDFVVVNGKKCKPPRFYDNLFELDSAVDFVALKKKRVERAIVNDDNSVERLAVREKIQSCKLKRLVRQFEGV